MNAAKRYLTYPRYNKNYIPCKLDVCSCLMKYILQSSYTNRFKYKKCYDKIELLFSISNKSVEHLFDEEV